VLEIEVLATRHSGWGWSSVIGGLGFLKDRFSEPYLFHWELEGENTRSLIPAVVPLRPFLGVMGVARAEDGAFRTRPPGPFGGNLDVRELCAGSTLYLPVYNRGALFSCVDLLVSRWRFSEIHAYILCSVALKLRLSQVVNEPVHTVSAALSKQILPDLRLFPAQ
jgi:acetamidase/formamidase